ncbi:MAG: hypothetical protein QG670_1046, partial [Thermoproteota archaeon]|nr:hypothetical protein [Thermoproteota archaeon]
EMTGDEGRTRAVSFIEITLSREGAVTENPKAEPSQSPLKEGS